MKKFIFKLFRIKVTYDDDLYEELPDNPEQFRLHSDVSRQQSKEVNQISKMFPSPGCSSSGGMTIRANTLKKSESKSPGKLTNCNGIANEIG